VMVSDLKYHDGVLSRIERIPADLRELYATAFEIEPLWLIKAASRRQKWIDQANRSTSTCRRRPARRSTSCTARPGGTG
jgi:ribonucleoside-diphosphate reductase alpha chain